MQVWETHPTAGLASVGENNNATSNVAVAAKQADGDESVPKEQAQHCSLLVSGVTGDAQIGFHDANRTVTQK
jgi:hypothetical protein